MNKYEWVDSEFNAAIVSNTGFTQLMSAKPMFISSSDYCQIKNRLHTIHDFQDRCINIFRNALLNKDNELLHWLLNETPKSLGRGFHLSLLDEHFKRPVFFRTDEMQLGKIAEIQCPGSHWGELELLHQYFKIPNKSPATLFSEQLTCYLGNRPPIVHYLTDNASAPTGVRYFIKKTRKTKPVIKYWGFDNGVMAKDCNFIRTHSFFGLCGENHFKMRLQQSSEKIMYDFPPYVLFDQKATLVLPFWEKTRNAFTDDIRNLIIYSIPLISDIIELDTGEKLTIDEFSKKPQSQRNYYLKYAGTNVSINWGSMAVTRIKKLGQAECKSLLRNCLEESLKGKIWLLQKEITVKETIEYFDKENIIQNKQMNAKYSPFYGPFGLIGILGYYRNHNKVHGQTDNILSLILPEE